MHTYMKKYHANPEQQPTATGDEGPTRQLANGGGRNINKADVASLQDLLDREGNPVKPLTYRDIYERGTIKALQEGDRGWMFPGEHEENASHGALLLVNVRTMEGKVSFGEAIERPNSLQRITENILARAELLSGKDPELLARSEALRKEFSALIDSWTSLQKALGDKARKHMQTILTDTSAAFLHGPNRTIDDYRQQYEDTDQDFLLIQDIREKAASKFKLPAEIINSINEIGLQLRDILFREQIFEVVDAGHEPAEVTSSHHAWADFCNTCYRLQMEIGERSQYVIQEMLKTAQEHIEMVLAAHGEPAPPHETPPM